MSRNIMSIGRIMYSKMPTKRKLSDFYGFGLTSILENTELQYILVVISCKIVEPGILLSVESASAYLS